MIKRDVKPYSKRKTTIILIVGFLGLILSFSMLIIAAILQENNASPVLIGISGVSFFPICIADVIFLVHHQPGITLRDIDKQLQVTKENGIEKVKLDYFNIENYCKKNKFKYTNEGYYYKRKISFTKDFINYYVKKVNSFEIVEKIKKEFDIFDEYKFKRNNICFLLFIEKDEITNEDLDVLLERSNIMISLEVIPNIINKTAVISLIDKSNKQLYISLPGKNKLTIYNSGYKFAKKIIVKKYSQ